LSTVTVTLNWTTPVSLWVQTYYRANRIKVLTAWSGGWNAWTINLRHSTTTANVFAVMPVWNNQTTICAYTVPLWKTLYIDRVNIQMARANWGAWAANCSLRERLFWTDTVFRGIKTPRITDSQGYTFSDNWYIVISERTDFVVRVDTVSDGNTTVSWEIDWILITN